MAVEVEINSMCLQFFSYKFTPWRKEVQNIYFRSHVGSIGGVVVESCVYDSTHRMDLNSGVHKYCVYVGGLSIET